MPTALYTKVDNHCDVKTDDGHSWSVYNTCDGPPAVTKFRKSRVLDKVPTSTFIFGDVQISLKHSVGQR